MALVVMQTRTLMLIAKYVFQRASDGLCFYQRRIPKDLKVHYPHLKGPTLRKSLKTKNPVEAARRGAKLAAEHDVLWSQLRSPHAKTIGLTTAEVRQGAKALLDVLDVKPGEGLQEWGADPLEDFLLRKYGEEYGEARHEHPDPTRAVDELVSPLEREAIRLVYEDPSKPTLLLSDVVDHYLRFHRNGQKPSFSNGVNYSLRVITECVGDLPLEAYTHQHARVVRDHLLSQGNATTSVRRRLRTINAFFNHGIGEAGHSFSSPFAKLKLPREGEDASTRASFTGEELQVIGRAVTKEDDDIRHIVAMLLDTGARVGEIVGLQAADLRLDEPVPHILIRPDRDKGRTLKTDRSVRQVPLVGVALWAARRANETMAKGQGWVFPRYAADGHIRSTHASNTINKWLRRVTGSDKTAHSLRHSMRDRLRAARVPSELQDLIGGWGSRTIGQRYGEGYPLSVLRSELEKVVLPE